MADQYGVNSLEQLFRLQQGSATSFPLAMNYPTLEDPFDRSRALVNRMVVRPVIGALSGISGIGAAGRGRNALAAVQGTQEFLEPIAQLSEPRTEGGKGVANAVDRLFGLPVQAGEYLGDRVYDYTGSPLAATAAYTAAQAAPMALGMRRGGPPAAKPGLTVVANEFSPKLLAGGRASNPPMSPILLNEGMGKALYDTLIPAVGPQQTRSRTAMLLDEPRYTERQPVAEWVKTLQNKQFPRDEPALLSVISGLKGMPVKQRLTKPEIQEMLNSRAPQLETVVARNPQYGADELFVRDPNEYNTNPEIMNRRADLNIEMSKVRNRYDEAVRLLEKFWGEHYRNGGSDILPPGPQKDMVAQLIEQRDVAQDRHRGIIEELSTMPEHRYDGHSWAQQKGLSEPIGRTRMIPRDNPDGTKTLVIDNFQKPTEGSGQRDKMPPGHEARAYDLMTQSVLNYAREKGFDNVEWTTGAEQNRRWGVQTPEVKPLDPNGWVEGEHFFTAKNGEPIKKWEQGGNPITEVRDYIPKDDGTWDTSGIKYIHNDTQTIYPTLEAAKEALAKGSKGFTPEGDLRPVYDKTLPKLMEKHGLGEKIGKGGIEEIQAREGFDVDPGDMEAAVMDAMESGNPIVARQAEKFNNEFLETGDMFDELLVDKPELRNWLTRFLFGEATGIRQSINVKGQQPQTLVYEGMGRALYNAIKGGRYAAKEREVQKGN